MQGVGVQHVVQVVTNMAFNYVAVAKLIMERHTTLFWTLYATHCFNLMLEDATYFIKEVIEHDGSITKYI